MTNICREEILPVLLTLGITAEDATEYRIPEPVLDDIADVVPLLPGAFLQPEIEIDPDDGAAVLRWFSPDIRQSFSLTFLGLGSVAGYLSSDQGDPAWKLSLTDRERLRAKLGAPAVIALVGA
jgi:hypothetical protein